MMGLSLLEIILVTDWFYNGSPSPHVGRYSTNKCSFEVHIKIQSIKKICSELYQSSDHID